MTEPSPTCFNCNEAITECECGDTETYEKDDGPVCPYCGHHNRACNSDGILYSESTTEYDCGDCGKVFDVGVSISFSWTARRR